MSQAIPITRLETKLYPSNEWALVRPFIPGEARCRQIIERVMTLSDDETQIILYKILDEYSEDHRQINTILLDHYEKVRSFYPFAENVTENRRLLIGSYFTNEYTLQSVALFNPSIVVHPDTDPNADSIRFILSLRAVGEGHISSVVFRQGIIDKNFKVKIRRPSRFTSAPKKIIPHDITDKDELKKKLIDVDLHHSFGKSVLEQLPSDYTSDDLRGALEKSHRVHSAEDGVDINFIEKEITNLSYSNSKIIFDDEIPLSERAIFPFCAIQSGGIEDVRFVTFTDDDGRRCYYGTYTAYDGRDIQPQLIKTTDFCSFDFISMHGRGAKNKGAALFPKKINGQYAMISRQDNENIFIMFSDKIHVWERYQLLLKPAYSWEFIQIGNCGSPIETDAGWLVLTHGVGAMREYCIGAFLLDKNDPTKVLGRLKKPLIKPNVDERNGYVPNVIYTCGALRVREKLLIPYTISDYVTGFAWVNTEDIIQAMV